MTAPSGEDRRAGASSSVSTVLERPADAASTAQAAEAARAAQLEEAWRAFYDEMETAVRTLLNGRRSPPEIAYAVGETVGNHFRTRGLGLTGLELRRLVARLLDRCDPPSSLVAFERPLAAANPWTGGEAAEKKKAPVFPDRLFAGAFSPLVSFSPEDRDGPGPVDRLWADRSVEAVFVHAFDAIWIERGGRTERVSHAFRDQAHLQSFVGRLAPSASSTVVPLRLRDGGEGIVLRPPLVPASPVVVLRRGRPGDATLERLVTAAVLSWPVADLLRLALRCRLKILVVGPQGSGKTAMLAALLRDLGDERRIATVANHRAYDWPSAAKVELKVRDRDPEPRLVALMDGVLRLRPDVVAIDVVGPDAAPAAETLLAQPGHGVLAALTPEAVSAALMTRTDLLVRLDRARDGRAHVALVADTAGTPLFVFEDAGFRRRTDRPAFAGIVQRAGYGKALEIILG